ncbi:MAG: hypothetical protein H0T73_02975, partial [Ardenticatenales bacterium]|nr:hypothetical protein [Ardenticatenales bacterium]
PARQIVATLAGFASVYFAFWLFGIMSSASLWQARFLITPLFLLCPVVAWGIQQVAEITTDTFPAAPLAYGLVGVWAVLAALITTTEFIRTEPLRYFFGDEQARAGWHVSRLGSYELLVREMQTLPTDVRPLLFYEPRAYRMPLHTEADTLIYEYAWRLARAEGDPAQLTAQLCAEKFTHVAIWWVGVRYQNSDEARVHKLSDGDLEKLEQWAQSHRSLWSVADEENKPVHELLELNCP